MGQTPRVRGFGRAGEPVDRTPRAVWAEWMAANEAEDVEQAGLLAAEMTRVAPDSFWSWFEAGLHAKARRDWAACAARNARAAGLFGDAESEELEGVNPAAWNWGIAATALGDWAAARRAWTAYGIDGLGDGAGPIDMDLGQVPVRVNPDRPSLTFQVVPALGPAEVVWCWRRSPAHAVIASVPLPESGHRFRDVLLHDGEPQGTRRLGDREVSVFDELDRLEDSGLPTWQALVAGAAPDDTAALGDLAGARGLGVDSWSGIAMMCSACSHGSPDSGHQHAQAPEGALTLGLAGDESELTACLDEWTSTRPDVEVAGLERLW